MNALCSALPIPDGGSLQLAKEISGKVKHKVATTLGQISPEARQTEFAELLLGIWTMFMKRMPGKLLGLVCVAQR